MKLVRSSKTGMYYEVSFQAGDDVRVSDELAEKLNRKYNFINVIGDVEVEKPKVDVNFQPRRKRKKFMNEVNDNGSKDE